MDKDVKCSSVDDCQQSLSVTDSDIVVIKKSVLYNMLKLKMS